VQYTCHLKQEQRQHVVSAIRVEAVQDGRPRRFDAASETRIIECLQVRLEAQQRLLGRRQAHGKGRPVE
jgi:hypothetical protein